MALSMDVNADNVAPLHKPVLLKETQDKFDKEGMNLSGNIFSITTQKVYFKKMFGEEIPDFYYTTDSIMFDEQGRITELFKNTQFENNWSRFEIEGLKFNLRRLYKYEGNDILVINQHRCYSDIDEWCPSDTIIYKRELDEKGRLTRETVYKDGNPISQISFTYTPTGYKVEYYPKLSADADTYELNNHTMSVKTPFTQELRKYNEKEKPLLYSGHVYIPFEKRWEYNKYGDITKDGDGEYSYEYDDNGNWVSKKWKNGWYVRKIIYKTLEERKEYQKQKLAREKAINDSLFALGASRIEENCNNFVNGILESRGYNAVRNVEKFGYDLPFEQKVSNVSTNADGSYNMTMASGAELKNLSFTHLKDYGPNCFVTRDGKTALILGRRRSYPFLGVVNFNIDVEGFRHNANKLANAMKSDTIAMIEFGKNLSSDTLWQKNYAKLVEQSNQYDDGINEINYIPFDVAIEMVYPKGFVENDNLREQFRKCADFISIKKAIEHIELDSKGKPLALKIKKWEQTGNNNYQFVFKDKEPSRIFSFDYTRIEDPYNHFLGEEFIMGCQRMGIEKVGISMDKRFIIVPLLYPSKNKFITFLVEIDNRGEYVASYYFERKI